MAQQTVRFFSKAQNYQILVKPYLISVNNGVPVHTRGEKIEFQNGEFSTEDKAIISFLRKHKAYGVDFHEDKTPVGADDGVYQKAQ